MHVFQLGSCCDSSLQILYPLSVLLCMHSIQQTIYSLVNNASYAICQGTIIWKSGLTGFIVELFYFFPLGSFVHSPTSSHSGSHIQYNKHSWRSKEAGRVSPWEGC